MQTIFLKILDYSLGRFLCTAFRGRQCRQSIKPRNILVIRPGGIGDAVLLLPMLQQLSDLYPDAIIEILAEHRNIEVFSWSPVISKVWLYDRPLSFVRLFRRRFDLVVDTEQWYRLSAVVARLLSVSRSIGFATNTRSRMFTDPCMYTSDEYEATMFLRLLSSLNKEKLAPTLDGLNALALPESEIFFKNPYVVIFTGASAVAKQWPAERFAEVARYCEKIGFDIVVLGGRSEHATSQIISRSLSRCHNYVAKTSLTESASIVSRAALTVSVDSGVLHIAQMLHIPTVALFGPSNHKKWCCTEGLNMIVRAEANCAPCSQFGIIPKCHHSFQCMQNITVEMVIEAISTLLRETGATV